MGLRIRNVVLDGINIYDDLSKGLEIINRAKENNENHMTLTGTNKQIDKFLQDKPIISERLRTLNNLPKYRIIGTTKQRIY